MLMRVYLKNSAGVSLGVLSVNESDTIVHYGGGYFARDCNEGVVFRGEVLPVFRQPETILTTYKLDIDLVAERLEAKVAAMGDRRVPSYKQSP